MNEGKRTVPLGFHPLRPRTGCRSLHSSFTSVVVGLAACAMAARVSAAPTEEAYRVRQGDTLWDIAHSRGITLNQLAERNGLNPTTHVRVGQRLLIPDNGGRETTAVQTASDPALPEFVQRAIDEAKVKPGRWKYIVIHHSGVDTGTVKGMDRYHREERHMENGLAYHFVIGNGSGMGDGEIGIGARWVKQLDGGHLTSERQNRISLGVCLVGNFDKHEPTPRQLERLTALVRALMKRCGVAASAVKTHQQINVVYTRCPGRHFPTKSFLRSLKSSGSKPPPAR